MDFGRVIPYNPSVGVVIGTYSSVPYIHLQLEARKRLYPNVPCLISDDGSPEWEKLCNLCKQYGADFVGNPRRLGHVCGDMSAFVHGIRWAAAKDVCLLVKLSRRWLFLKPWVENLQQLAYCNQMPTYSNKCTSNGFGFRSECLAMHVPGWMKVVPTLLWGIENNWTDLAEAFYDQRCSQKIPLCEAAKKVPTRQYGSTDWSIMGTSRYHKQSHVVWHCANPPEDYLKVSQEWNLPYTIDDFRKIN